MSFRTYVIATAAVSALVAADTRTAGADPFFGALVGGFIGSAIGSQTGQRPRTTQPRTQQRAQPSGAAVAQRQANRDLQTALNFFGFDVGTPDGALGPRSRGGISQYQAYLGFPATGQATDFERSILMTAWNRAQAGGPQVTRVTARHRDGMRGLLEAVRDEMSGAPQRRTAGAYGLPAEVADGVDEIAASSDPSAEQLVQRSGFIQLADLNGDGRTDYILDTSVTGSAFWCNAQACTVRVYVSTPDGYSRNDFQTFNVTPAAFDCLRGTCTLRGDAGATAVAAVTPMMPQGGVAAPVASAQPMVQNPGASAPALPNFFGGQAGQTVSLASHCNRVALVTSANGGFVTAATLSDPVFAMNEQFCLARSYAIAEGEGLAAQVPGATPQMIAEQCAAFAPVLQPHVAALSIQPQGEVTRGLAQFVLGSGMAPTDLAATARICLSSGYLTENMTVAIGSALLLHALGETGYGELPAQHLLHGIGAPARQETAMQWFAVAVPQAPGARPVGFAPGPEARTDLIRAALDMLNGAPAPAAVEAVPVTTAPAPLPLFNLRGGN